MPDSQPSQRPGPNRWRLIVGAGLIALAPVFLAVVALAGDASENLFFPLTADVAKPDWTDDFPVPVKALETLTRLVAGPAAWVFLLLAVASGLAVAASERLADIASRVGLAALAIPPAALGLHDVMLFFYRFGGGRKLPEGAAGTILLNIALVGGALALLGLLSWARERALHPDREGP